MKTANLTYVGTIDILEKGEAIALTVYAGNDFDSCIGAISKEIKIQKRQFKAFNIQVWVNGVRVELSDVSHLDRENDDFIKD